MKGEPEVRAFSRSEEHVGEWKVTLWADTLEELFAEAARLVARTSGPQGHDARGNGDWERIELEGNDRASLLVDWLNELLGRSEIQGRSYGEVRDLRITGSRLQAEVRGRPVRAWRSPLKAATYHGLELKPDGRRWRAVVLFDV